MHFSKKTSTCQKSQCNLNLRFDNEENHLAFRISPTRKSTLPPSLPLFLSHSPSLKYSVLLWCCHLPSPDVTFDLFFLPPLKGGKHATLCCRENMAYYVIYITAYRSQLKLHRNMIMHVSSRNIIMCVFTCGN